MMNDEGTTHDENCKESEDDAVRYYSVEHGNEEDNSSGDDVIYLVDGER